MLVNISAILENIDNILINIFQYNRL